MDEAIRPREDLDELATRISQARQLNNIAASEAYGIRPSFDHVLVQQPKHGVAERNGLFIPAVGRSMNEAEVLAVGPGRLHDGVHVPVHVRPGDKVILCQAAYHPIAIDVEKVDLERGEKVNERVELLLVKEGLIIATVAPNVTLLNASPKKNYAAEWEAVHDGD